MDIEKLAMNVSSSIANYGNIQDPYNLGYRYVVYFDGLTRTLPESYYETKKEAKAYIEDSRNLGYYGKWTIRKLKPIVIGVSEHEDHSDCPYRVVRSDCLLDFEFPVYFRDKKSAKAYAKQETNDIDNVFGKKYKVEKV